MANFDPGGLSSGPQTEVALQDRSCQSLI